MIRNHKWKLIISSVILLLPILVGLILWDSLPDQLVTHWGIDGQPDGWSGKSFVVFGLPLILLAIHWFGIFFTVKDPKNAAQSLKIIGMMPWLVPLLSLLVSGTTYATALGTAFDMLTLSCLFMGLLFTVIGNYLPKCKQSYTIGIKISWTLNSEANWLATHRFAGRVWTVGGLLVMIFAFLPTSAASVCALSVLIVMAVAPMIYSYRYHKQEVTASQNGDSTQN